jgi:hypothetical protein
MKDIIKPALLFIFLSLGKITVICKLILSFQNQVHTDLACQDIDEVPPPPQKKKKTVKMKEENKKKK